jgi:hypothetical protein
LIVNEKNKDSSNIFWGGGAFLTALKISEYPESNMICKLEDTVISLQKRLQKIDSEPMASEDFFRDSQIRKLIPMSYRIFKLEDVVKSLEKRLQKVNSRPMVYRHIKTQEFPSIFGYSNNERLYLLEDKFEEFDELIIFANKNNSSRL